MGTIKEEVEDLKKRVKKIEEKSGLPDKESMYKALCSIRDTLGNDVGVDTTYIDNLLEPLKPSK